MSVRHNRNVKVEVRQYDGAGVGSVPFDQYSFDGLETRGRMPLDISARIQKSITSNTDQATIRIRNPLVLESIYQKPDEFRDLFTKNDFSVSVFAGYDTRTSMVFSGDLQAVAVSGDSITDRSLVINAGSGYLAMSRGTINEKIGKGTSYKATVDRCFQILAEEFGIELVVLEDPDNKLNKTRKKPFTAHRPVREVLNDICRELDMTWGIDSRQEITSNQRAYFVDKKSAFDVLGQNGIGPHAVNAETGKIGIISVSKTKFTFASFPDKHLNIGVLVEATDLPQINSQTKFNGRINSIGMRLSNRRRGFDYRCVCSFWDGNEAILEDKRRNVSASMQE